MQDTSVAVLKGARTAATATALAATLGLAAACWVLALRQMTGMDMGVATRLGSFASFIALWLPMMAAMMLPGTAAAVVRRAQSGPRLYVVPLFLAGYLAVWALVGVAVYALYRPHGTVAAGVLTIAAGVYELTPVKRYFRRCAAGTHSGVETGLYCLGSTIGLMLVLLALGVMSAAWMVVIAVLVLAQKLLPPKVAVDVPVALAVIWLGALILIAPSSVPGLLPAM